MSQEQTKQTYDKSTENWLIFMHESIKNISQQHAFTVWNTEKQAAGGSGGHLVGRRVGNTDNSCRTAGSSIRYVKSVKSTHNVTHTPTTQVLHLNVRLRLHLKSCCTTNNQTLTFTLEAENESSHCFISGSNSYQRLILWSIDNNNVILLWNNSFACSHFIVYVWWPTEMIMVMNYRVIIIQKIKTL